MDAIETDITTLTAHILSQQQHFKEATGDFSILINAIATACKWITNVVRKAELLHVIGNTGVHNVQQESVQKLDILSNNIMINMLKGSGKTCLLVSEELERELTDGHGHYCVVFDPLDGSSNIDCGVAVGTIFGIYRVDRSLDLLPQIMCSGSNMIASGYCMYGSCSILVLALGGHVNGYTLDPDIGEFLLTHRKVDFLTQIKLGTKKIYSLNEGYSHSFDPAIAAYLDTLKNPAPGQTDFKPYSARYVGSMVADMHRTLLYGGVFLYPGGKLRLLYECFPMAMIIEAAGGKASNGKQRILDLKPKSIHDRSPIFLGTASEVEAIERYYAK